MTFHVGQLVVCVNAELTTDYPPPPGSYWIGNLHGLTKGRVYTVRDFCHRAPYEDCIRLVEIIRPTRTGREESGYSASRFRPITDSRLAIFRRLLAPVTEDA